MRSRGFGVVGTVVAIGMVLVIALVGWGLAGPHLRKARMETAVGELLERGLRGGDEELAAAVIEAGARNGLAIQGDGIAIRREGKKVTITVEIPDEANLLVMKVPSTSILTVEREVSWARGILDNTQEKIDRAVQQQQDRFSNAPLE